MAIKLKMTIESMKDKSVYELPGIDENLGDKLMDKGYIKAWDVLSMFLVLYKDKNLFGLWLKKQCGANSYQQAECFNCLDELFTGWHYDQPLPQ